MASTTSASITEVELPSSAANGTSNDYGSTSSGDDGRKWREDTARGGDSRATHSTKRKYKHKHEKKEKHHKKRKEEKSYGHHKREASVDEIDEEKENGEDSSSRRHDSLRDWDSGGSTRRRGDGSSRKPEYNQKSSKRDAERSMPVDGSRHYRRRRSPSPRRSDVPAKSPTDSSLPISSNGNHAHESTRRGSVAAQDLKEPKEVNEASMSVKPVKKFLSLEEMMEKKKEENKPTKVLFLTKSERQKIAQEKELEDKEKRKQKERDEITARREFMMQEELERERLRRDRQKEREAERQKREEERATKDEEEKLKAEESKKIRKNELHSRSALASLDLLELPENELRARQQEKELEQIRDHYLGMRKEKKKIQKPSEKFRNIFNFEWDASEDTARGDNNPLYQSRVEPQLLFGRGYRAGIDVREQRKYHDFYDQLVKQRIKKGESITAFDTLLKPTADIRARDLDVEVGDPAKKHWSEKTKEAMNDRDWRIFREDFEIYIKGGRVPAPIRTWAESPLPWELLEAIRHANYVRPTPIQMQAIPIALEQRDLIGIAETGSGKTAAFVLPMLTYVKSLPSLTDETSQDGAYALVLAPSRELALQIEEETKKFASFCKCRTVAVVGGRNAEDQAFMLRRGAEIIIGTPGRVKDCLERQFTVLNQCNYVVLDEADRMIDMGFEDIVNQILDMIPTSNLKSEDEALALQQEMQAKAGHRLYRLTQMFSATMPAAVERLTRKYLRAPAYISIGDPGAGKRSIEQRLEFMGEGKKKQRLQEVLEESEPPIIVFVNQKKVADVIAKSIGKMGYRATSLHGGKAQENRESALTSFKAGEYDILVATDVAGRGIDIDGVQLVINFDMPKDIEAYTHRIGRTGRAGKKGLSISFVTEDNSEIFYDLKQLLLSTNNIVPLELSNHAATKAKPGQAASQAKRNQVLFKN